jgi:hypothetical protein
VQQALEDNEEGDRMSARTKKGMMLEGEWVWLKLMVSMFLYKSILNICYNIV